VPPLQVCRWMQSHVLYACAGAAELHFAGQAGLRDALFCALVANATDLVALNLAGCRHLSDHSVCTVARQAPGLAEVDLSNCTAITDRAVQALVRGCSKLSSLKLQNCRISDAALIVLGNECCHLSSVDITGCRGVTYPACVSVACRCTQFICDADAMAGAGEYPHVTSLTASG